MFDQAVLRYTLSTAFVFPTRLPVGGDTFPARLGLCWKSKNKTERKKTDEEETCGNALGRRAGGGPAVPFRLRRHGRISQPGRFGNSGGIEHANAGGNTHADVNTHTHTDTDTYTYTHTDADAYTHADTDAYAHADTDAHADA